MTPIDSSLKLETPVLAHLTLGDWPEDGHRQHERFYYYVNYPVASIQQAYKNSCERLGIQFNHGQNYMEPGSRKAAMNQVFTEYRQNGIRPHERKILEDAGILTDTFLDAHGLENLTDEPDDRHLFITDVKDCADLIMEFIAYSMPRDFVYTDKEWEPSEPVNEGRGSLNIQFGYGLFE